MNTATSQTPEQVLEQAQKLWAQGKSQKTYDLVSTYLRANPNDGPLLHFFAGVLEKQGNIFGAIKHLEFACKAPNSQSLYFLDLASLLGKQQMYVESQNVLTVAMKRDPGNQEIQAQLGSMLILNGFFDQGVKLFSHVMAQSPSNWQRWTLFANSVAKSSRPKQAAELYDQALEIMKGASTSDADVTPSPADIANTLMAKADHLKTIGDKDGCTALIRAAIAQTKYVARAWAELATLKAFTDDDVATVEKMIGAERGKLSKLDLQYLHHALGLAYMTRDDGKAAMAHYLKANAYQREQIDYNEEKTLAFLANLPNFFTPDAIAGNTLNETGDEQQFIFIVGMPRCGSTLLEQVLDSHSDAFGVGEIRTLPGLLKRAYGDGFPSLPAHKKLLADPKRLALFAKAYRDEVLRMLPPEVLKNGKGPRYIVDKMLGNFVSVGLIAMAFPNSKIIHARRDPMDTAFSCFTHFFADGHKYLCDLREIGNFYVAYRDLMAYWEKTLSKDQLITVDYEKVIADLDHEARRLVDFLGLDWQDACLEFYANTREVRTHSALEVRQPVYNSSLERWRPYQKELTPLIEALGINPD
ncbi:tetratricopeptide repeat-containing sulfotransferase family protein [Thalassospira sp. MIT1370]|uniref:tetratricopeptide repeat-containing sulfotransferase family protein n=1 Tax=unclassified Thalassospira TaxID=2648997 RepID=UPI00399994C8